MARLVFPSSPSVGDIFQANDRAWRWDGKKWKAYSEAAPQTFANDVTIESKLIVTVQDTTYPGITVSREENENDVHIYWDNTNQQWSVTDDDSEYDSKKILVEYDTLDGGDY